MNFSADIISWYEFNKRDLPWRTTKNPYYIWLSEVILQQTRVDQGLKYYLKFIEVFPVISKLASAPEKKIMKLWQGLGYYSRARNMHATAKYISKELKGVFPSDYEELLQLKGVGSYTAAAIASIAFERPHAVLDGNVFRVLSRVFGIKEAIDSSAGKKSFTELAESLLDRNRPSLYNQAVMEFGATWCKPRNTDCMNCIFNNSCLAFNSRQVDNLPVKQKKTKVRKRYFHYFIIEKKDEMIIRKRTGDDIWQNLYEFPLIEVDSECRIDELEKTGEWKKLFGNHRFTVKSVSIPYKHVLSHQVIFTRFWELRQDKKIKFDKSWVIIKRRDFKNFPVSRLIERYMVEKN